MTINTAVFSFIRKVEFNHNTDNYQYPMDDIFWKSIYYELKGLTVLDLVPSLTPDYIEISIGIRKMGWMSTAFCSPKYSNECRQNK